MAEKRTSYEDIVSRTVPEPDSSFRPTEQQREDTRRGVVHLDGDEQALLDKVRGALGDAAGVTAEVRGNRVMIQGKVADMATLQQIAAAVAAIEGVGSVDNQLFVA